MNFKRVYNFNPGPAILPLEALEYAHDHFMDFGGMSILEISHRSKEFANIIDEARALIKKLMEIPDNYDILFLQGGASIHFAMIPLNFLKEKADFAITGHWSKRAKEEAAAVGETNTAYSSEEGGFKKTPKSLELNIDENTSYIHITTNNTIYGTEYQEIPDTKNIPLVADMSSDILSQKIDISRFSLIYAGAQKNLGPSGVSVVIIKKDLLNTKVRNISSMLTYSAHAEKQSLYNTPPVFSIYILNLVLKWLKGLGGVETIEKINREKAALIYEVLDSSSMYKAHADKDSRSLMNITFTLPSQELTDRFISEAKERDLFGLKGHRSVGGIRASIYNAFPIEGVKLLTEFMKEFEKTA